MHDQMWNIAPEMRVSFIDKGNLEGTCRHTCRTELSGSLIVKWLLFVYCAVFALQPPKMQAMCYKDLFKPCMNNSL